MYSTISYKLRVYPDTKRQEEIDKRLILACQLYNKILEKIILEYEKNKGSKINKAALNNYMKEAINENKEFLKLYSQTRQDIFIRIQNAFQRFFQRVNENKNGRKRKVGFPRFKSIDRYKSLTYPQNNGAFSIENARLRISRIGTMKIEIHRLIEGKIKTLIIKREAGKYYAIFTAIKEIELPKINDTNFIGIDLGLNSFIAMSNGRIIKKPNFMQDKRTNLAKWQRILSRKEKCSKRREKTKLKLQRKWEHINNQSSDYLHKLSNGLIDSGYTSFAVEKLNIQKMVKDHHLAKSIYSASWRKFIQMLSYKAESAGLRVIEVDPTHTSQICSSCGDIHNMPLSERIYVCKTCGLQIDRDINAAINILNRATAGHAGSNARGDTTNTIQQVSQAESLSREHTSELISINSEGSLRP